MEQLVTGPLVIFDVNETLLDIDSVAPIFSDIFDDPTVLREWFGQLVMYSMTVTLSRCYVDFFTLGRAVLQMIADGRGMTVADADLDRLAAAMASMPAHHDVGDGLDALRRDGFRLVSLTNSPPTPEGPSPLDRAGLGEKFERQFSVDPCRAFKPDPAVYLQVCREMDVAPAQCVMVAAHSWDILGAQAVGMQGALITRPGNAVLPAPGLRRPDVLATDLVDLARQLKGGPSTLGVLP